MSDTKHYLHLVKLAEIRHFGRASQTLGISQSALSKSIQRLEQELGVKLLDRSRKKVLPTAMGEVVIQHARRLIAGIADLHREVDLLQGADIGAVSVGVGPAMGESYFSSAIARMAESHPGTHIRVRTDHWKQLSQWLFAGELDLFVADITEHQSDRRVEIIRLPSEELIWFCRAGHPLVRARHVMRKDLLSYPLVTPKMPSWAVSWFAEVAAPKSVAGQPPTFGTVACESYSMLKRMVLNSNSISAALTSTIATELQAGDLVKLPIKSPSIKTRAGIARLRDRTLSPIAEVLIREILTVAGFDQAATDSSHELFE